MVDGLIVIGLFVFVSCIVLPWINFTRIQALQREMADVVRRLNATGEDATNTEVAIKLREEPFSAAPLAILPYDSSVYNTDHYRKNTDTEAAASLNETDVAPLETKNSSFVFPSFELQLGTKLPVWIGALSLICAAFFLVKYSIEAGWMGPATRVFIGGLFGAVLVATGQWTGRRDGIANNVRIAQGLVGAGLVALYISLYAAVHLYGLIGPLTGFCGLSIVTAMAVILSLRHGQPIAAFGLLGGLLTPLLVGSTDPQALPLFGYLFVLFACLLFVLVRRGWWVLACAALGGVLLWDGVWLATDFTAGDDAILALFAIGLCGAVLFATGSCRRAVADADDAARIDPARHGLNLLSVVGGALAIAALNFKYPLSLFDWSALEVLSIGCFILAFFQPEFYKRLPLGKLVLDLLLFALWAPKATPSEMYVMLGVLATIYAVVPAFIMRRLARPDGWAVLQAVAAIVLYLIAHDRLSLPPHVWGISGLILSALSIYQAREMRLKFLADNAVQDRLVALYALSATAFLSLVLAIIVPSDYLPLAFAGQVAATLWIRTRVDVAFLKVIAAILVGLLIAVEAQAFLPFIALAAESLLDGKPSPAAIQAAIVSMPFIRFGIPALLLGVGLVFHWRRDQDVRLAHLLFGTALAFGLAMGYCLVRQLLNGNPALLGIQASFLERGVITLMLAALGVAIMAAVRPLQTGFMRIWGQGLFHIAMLRIAYFDLLLFNPYFNAHQFVGAWPVVNGVTMIYGTGAALAVWAADVKDWGAKTGIMRSFYKVFSIVLLFAFSSLTVRQYFHGGWPAIGPMGNSELYSYSIVWLVLGLSLLALGIVRHNRAVRLASLAFMVLSIGKVFLFDAAQLQGLLRVFSFLGLGISLIGLSFFYTRFVFREGAEEEP